MAEEVSGLLTTGLLAILGTVIGGVIKGYWDNRLADKDLQSKLILRALEPDNADERKKSLEFLVDTNLISDKKIKNGVNSVIKKNRGSIPQFFPENWVGRKPGVRAASTAREGLSRAESSEHLALVALQVRYGDIIDAVTPIFAKILPDDLSFDRENRRLYGQRIGGAGGGEKLLEKDDGYIITGIDIYKGLYFGRDEVIHIQVFWNRLTRTGISQNDKKHSERLGSGNYARVFSEPQKFRVDPGCYISDFRSLISDHTSGETFLHDIQFSQRKLPISGT